MSENLENLFNLLPLEILELVFELLSVQDLLNMCLTCKLMNEIIGCSRNSMQRFWIKFYTFKLKDLQCLSESERNYEKLKINRVKENDHFEFLHQLLKPWSKILIYNCEIKQFPQLSKVLQNCSDTIEELELSDIQILNNEYQIPSINFSRLQRVMFRNVPSTIIELFLGNNVQLGNLAFDIVQEISRQRSLSELVTTLLKNTKSLKMLQLGPHYIKNLFDSENFVPESFEFKLEKLMLKFPIIPENSELIMDNISKFLLNQSNIDWIVFWELHNDEILSTIWNKKPTISHITFIGLESLFDDSMDLKLEPNIRIDQIELLSRKLLLSQLRKILKSAPNLRILHVFSLTKYVMECIAKSHFNIREIRYETIDEEVSELYENLIKSGEDDINCRISSRQVSFWRDAPGQFLVDPKFWHS